MTGHRFLSGEGRVADGIDLVLRQAELAYGARPLTLLSPLARGADQLVARRALLRSLRSDTELVVPLPMPLAEYLDDFAVGTSRDAFLELLSQATETVNMPPTTARDEAYQAVGRFVVEQSDLLMAVWDGKPARGQGGTGQIVAEARRRGLPLAWILADNRAGHTSPPLSQWGEEGTVRFERFAPGSQDR